MEEEESSPQQTLESFLSGSRGSLYPSEISSENGNTYTAPPNTPEHFQELLNRMQSEDVMEVLQAVCQISMDLAVAPEDLFSNLPLEAIVNALVAALHNEVIPDISLYAILSLHSIVDTIHNATRLIAAAGGIPALTSKLMNLDFIDLAENTIKLLEKLSYEHCNALMKEQALSTMLNMIDFFDMNTQKRILNIVVVSSRSVSSDELFQKYLVPVIPLISTIIPYRGDDALPMTQLALDFFLGMAESAARLSEGDPELLRNNLETIAEHGILNNLIETVTVCGDKLNNTFPLLKALTLSTTKNTFMMISSGVIDFLKKSLDKVSLEAKEGSKGSALFIDILQLISHLLPSKEPSNPVEAEKINIFMSNPELLNSIGNLVFPQVLSLYEKFVSKGLRNLVLEILEKLLSKSETDALVRYVTPQSFATFMAELLGCKYAEEIKAALGIVIVLYDRVGDQIAGNFIREGVVSRLESLKNIETLKELNFPRRNIQELLAKGYKKVNLKQFLMKSGIPEESALLKELMTHLSRRSSLVLERAATLEAEEEEQSEEEEEPITELRRNLSEPAVFPDPMEESYNEIINLSMTALSKTNRADSAREFFVLNELSSLANKFNNGTGESEIDSVRKLANLIVAEQGVTLHEFSSSGIIEALYKWLTGDMKSDKLNSREAAIISKRLFEFFEEFLKVSRKEETYLEELLNLLIGKLRYMQQFSILLYESSSGVPNFYLGLKTLSNKVRVKLVYSPDLIGKPVDTSNTELEAKHLLFSEFNELALPLEQYQTFDTIKDALIRIRAKEDIDLLRASFERSAQEARGISQGQLNLVRQSLMLQQLLTQSIDLESQMAELGIRPEGNEDLLKELQIQRQNAIIERMMKSEREDVEEHEEEDIEGRIIEAFELRRKESLMMFDNIDVRICFNGTPLSRKMTVFEAIQKYINERQEEGLVLHFAFCNSEKEDIKSKVLGPPNLLISDLIKSSKSVGVPENDKVYTALSLLKLLYNVNSSIPKLLSAYSSLFPFPASGVVWNPVNSSAFQSVKLSALLARQVQDVLAIVGGTAPDWVVSLTKACPFLFGFPVRIDLFKSKSMTGVKVLHYYSSKLKEKQFTVRMLKQKAMVPRDNILEAAMRIMHDTGILKHGMLEFDYQNEEGTGLGPTLEFYTLVSREILKMPIWRNSGEEVGLFPCPILEENQNKTLDYFEFVGRFIGKAIFDEKLIDVPLSPAFIKLLLGKPLYISDMLSIDSRLGRTLLELQELVNRKNYILSRQDLPSEAKEKQILGIDYKGISVGDLALHFTLPGYDSIELKPNGKNLLVTLDNLEEYIQLVCEATMLQTLQADAFRKGFETLISIDNFQWLVDREIEEVLCGEDDAAWDLTVLQNTAVPAHGYTRSSVAYQNLLKVMTSFNSEERKLFIKFVTGSNRLPLGGFKALSPPLTVVRKLVTGDPDKYLPSVMTCQNYLKLPEYSSSETLAKNLRHAIREGNEAFHLS